MLKRTLFCVIIFSTLTAEECESSDDGSDYYGDCETWTDELGAGWKTCCDDTGYCEDTLVRPRQEPTNPNPPQKPYCYIQPDGSTVCYETPQG